MAYLLDTHVLLWLINQDSRLSGTAKKSYSDPNHEIYLSCASLWEIAIKISKQKLHIPGTLEDFVSQHVRGNGIRILDIKPEHLYLIERLPFHHRDPFDRLLIAQSMVENYPIISSDKSFKDYAVKKIW